MKKRSKSLTNLSSLGCNGSGGDVDGLDLSVDDMTKEDLVQLGRVGQDLLQVAGVDLSKGVIGWSQNCEWAI